MTLKHFLDMPVPVPQLLSDALTLVYDFFSFIQYKLKIPSIAQGKQALLTVFSLASKKLPIIADRSEQLFHPYAFRICIASNGKCILILQGKQAMDSHANGKGIQGWGNDHYGTFNRIWGHRSQWSILGSQPQTWLFSYSQILCNFSSFSLNLVVIYGGSSMGFAFHMKVMLYCLAISLTLTTVLWQKRRILSCRADGFFFLPDAQPSSSDVSLGEISSGVCYTIVICFVTYFIWVNMSASCFVFRRSILGCR